MLARLNGFLTYFLSLFLTADDGSVEIPDEEGNLNVDCMDVSLVWTCDGDSSKPAAECAPSTSSSQFAYQPPDERGDKRKRNRWAPKFTTSMLHVKKGAHEAKQSSLTELTWTKNGIMWSVRTKRVATSGSPTSVLCAYARHVGCT